jgi:hypothetical protein
MADVVTFLPCVRGAPGLNFGGNTDYPEVIRGFLSIFRENVGAVN